MRGDGLDVTANGYINAPMESARVVKLLDLRATVEIGLAWNITLALVCLSGVGGSLLDVGIAGLPA